MEKNNGTIFFALGFLLIFFLWNIVCISTALNIIGVSMTNINIMVAILSCLLFITRYYGQDSKNRNKCCMYFLLIIIITTLFCGSLFDYSWDGNNYQKAIVGMIEEGWNPIYSIYDVVANERAFFPTESWPTWYDAYPKASSIIGAAFYALTNNIETGKAYTILSCLAGALIVQAFFCEQNKGDKTINFLITGILFFNPVSIAQCGTFYNDAFLWNLLFITIFILLYLTLDKKKRYEKVSWILLFCCISLGINIKFSALIYFALICGSFYCYWLYETLKIKKQKRDILNKVTLFFIVTVLFSVCFLGSTSYMKNLVIHHNPVYTMIGENKTEIIDAQSPQMFQSVSHAKRFIISIFSESSNDKTLMETNLKVPFTIAEKEKELDWVETRIGGWGPLFSGIFVSSLLAILVLWKGLSRDCRKSIFILISVTFIPVFFVPGLYWARYWMILFIIPCLAMYLLGLNKKTKIVAILLLTVSFVNIFLPLAKTVENIKASQFTKIQYIQLKELSEENSLEVKLGGSNQYIFNGLVFNLRDYQINDYKFNNKLENEKYISKGNGKISYKIITEPNHET